MYERGLSIFEVGRRRLRGSGGDRDCVEEQRSGVV